MNIYYVHGLHYLDMCGSAETVPLGVIILQDHQEQLELRRPKTGFHKVGNRTFSNIYFEKAKQLSTQELTCFKDNSNETTLPFELKEY